VPRVLVINDYSLEDSWRGVREGQSPRHFLYGVDHLAAQGFDLTILSDEWSPWLAAVDRRLGRLRIPFGSIDRQMAAVRLLGRADAIYAPCQTQIQTLTYLRAAGVVRAPIVCLAHHPLVRGRIGALTRPLVSLMLRGLSAMPALSHAVAAEANRLAHRTLARALRWGPDADFYPAPQYPGHGILAAGRTGRDFATFGRAATAASVPATILTFRSMASSELYSLGHNVAVLTPETFISYAETARMFATARALAIPMLAQDGLCGLTSLMDALGAGKPVIMTRNALIDLDIEGLGIGKWIEPGDVSGWTDALRYFHDNPDSAVEMGRRARRLVDEGLNYRAFSEEIVAIIRASLSGSSGE
jgi:hypothetical protein